MDLREYYANIRRIEKEIAEPLVVIVSRRTGDGGRRGVMSEVPRELAARMIADGKAELADAESAAEHRATVRRKWENAQGVATAFEPVAGRSRPARSGQRKKKA